MSKREGKKEVKFKAAMKPEQLADYLEGLVNGLRQGCLTVDTEKGSLSLQTTEIVAVKIEATEKKDKCKLELELSWAREAPDVKAEETVDQARELAVSTGEEGTAPDNGGDGDDDQGETEGEPLKTSYKKIKKSMQRAVKDIKAALDRGEIPPVELTEALVSDCEALTTMPGKGDDQYPEFCERVQRLAQAARSGDLTDVSTALEAVLAMKKECHSNHK